jgi:hypothetical protein
MANQKGYTFVSGIVIGALVIAGLGLAYYYGAKNTQSTQSPPALSSIAPNPSTVVSATTNPTTSWKTYTIAKQGASFKYPADYTVTVKNDVTAQLLLSIKGPTEEYSLDIAPIGQEPGSLIRYSDYPPFSNSDGTKVFNGKTWEHIPARTFGDAGQTFTSGQKYQINNGKYRFDFELITPKDDTPTYEQVLSSFEITN